ncbi:MAG: FadR family transcriptional regulator [Acidobacteriia bacterium]|nr:FadR family transcriptional regulator [Terriglobia bacterium]
MASSSPMHTPQRGNGKATWKGSAEQVVSFVRHLIERGQLCPGDRLSAERDLALQIGVSRPTVRVGLRALSAMGVVQSRPGSGTYITAGPPSLGTEPLNFQAALHGFTQEQMFEARRILEVGAAGLAAQRARPEAIAKIADEVSNLFAAIDEKELFLVHDMSFHRAVAAASENPIVASLVEMVSTLFYERRKQTARLATDTNLRDAAQMHRLVYQAIRAHDPEAARSAMDKHLLISGQHQAQEQSGTERRSALLPGPGSRSGNERSPRRRKGRQYRGDE